RERVRGAGRSARESRSARSLRVEHGYSRLGALGHARRRDAAMDGNGRGTRGLEALFPAFRRALSEHSGAVGDHFRPPDTDSIFGGRLLVRLSESADSGLHEIRGACPPWFAASIVCGSARKGRKNRGTGIPKGRVGTER